MRLVAKRRSAFTTLAWLLFSTLCSIPNDVPGCVYALVASTGTAAAVQSRDPVPSPLPERVPVAIIGGGLGGLAVFAALKSRGIEAHIFESAPTLLRGSTGTGIMISPNGMTALEAVDPRLPAQMRAGGSRIVRQRIQVTDPLGTVVKKFPFDMTTEQINIGWSRAQEILASFVPEKFVHCGARFASYRQSDGDETVDVQFADGRSVRASLLIGCDGAGSAVRRVMAHAKNKDPKKADASYATRYSGQLLWNAIVPSGDVRPRAHAPGEVEYMTCGTDGQVVLTFDAGEEQTSWYLTLMEDYVQGTEGNALCPEIQAALDDNSFGGFGREGIKSQLEKAFASWPVALACLQATPESQIFERRLSDRPVLMDWTDHKNTAGRVILMGDAAHPMIPSQGQGTMMTWEDAADLAACVAPSLVREGREEEHDGSRGGGGSALSTAVQEFVSQRAKRCARVQRHSAEAYMGRKGSNFFPKKVMRMLGLKRSMEYITDGYQPIQTLDKVGFRKKVRSLFKRK
mmetsp:Transcript_45574/g.89035  ORF Transcript_45574/g.89035 Transcript_45574/m.89035 type:complete len:516 (-) Transcript_45574:27-1574(-)